MARLKKNILRWLPLFLVVMIGIALSFGISRYVQHSHEEHVTERFQSAAKDRIKIIRNALEDDLAMERSIIAFFNASDSVERNEFDTMSSQLLKDHADVFAVSWMPLITNNERASFEQKTAQEFPGFAIKDATAAGDIVKADNRSEYFPLYYVKPFAENAPYLGLDVAGRPGRRDAFMKARERGDIVATEKIIFLSTQQAGVSFFAPVYYKSKDKIANGGLQGFVSMSLSLKSFVDKALESLAPEGVNLILRDLSAAPDNNILYISSSALAPEKDNDILQMEKSEKKLTAHEIFTLGARQWEIEALPASGFYSFNFPLNENYVVLIVGLFVTFLIAAYLFMQITQKDRIQEEVYQRTRELARTKERMELLLDSTSDGVIGLDGRGKITFANPHAASLLKQTVRDMVGQHFELFFHKGESTPFSPLSSFEETYLHGKSCTSKENVFRRKDGINFPVDFTSSPLHDDDEIVGAVISFRDIQEQKKYEDNLRFMAQYDQLTALANRSLFVDLMKKSIAKAARIGTKVGVIYLDLNDFKIINDTMGHAAGDILLAGFANRVSATLRTYDTMARIGGDEFTVIADHIHDEKECYIVVNRIVDALSEPFVIQDKKIQIHSSIGVALYPDHGKTVDELLHYADSAMYQHKKNLRAPQKANAL